jgi:hypothetical protein
MGGIGSNVLIFVIRKCPMTEFESLVLDHLQYIRSGLDELSKDIRELKMRLGDLIKKNDEAIRLFQGTGRPVGGC